MEEVLGLEEPLGEPHEGNVDPTYSLSGIGSSTRLRRNLHFPHNSFPNSLALDSTLTTPPFSRPPLSVTQDPILNQTLSSHPHLFTVSTPLATDLLSDYLSIHPNQPLVESVIIGLREGFWPGHDGDFSKLTPERPTFQSDEDLDFITKEKLEDWELGRLSDPFDTLLPGMHISPTFVVRSDVRKSRTVCDQSVSGLNDGILREDATTTYDTIPQLGGLLRLYHHLELDKNHHTLWKSDVSGAFRNIPVSPFWMIKQVHRVRLVRPGRKPTWSYYVDQRLILGGRLSPRIWCTVINLILWCARIRSKIAHLYIFVDDAFSCDFSGTTIPVFHKPSKETRLVPLDQGKLLRVWNHLGIPWSWKKQVFSDSKLDVIGFSVDATNLSVTLSDASKLTFRTVTLDFLSPSDKPLVVWQRLLGHANWALNVLPFAKFALRSSFKKIKGKKIRMGRIHHNVEVKRDISWLLEEVLTAPPLFLLDPALVDWIPSDADVIIHTDACLRADKSTGSGIAFTSKLNGVRFSFYHRSSFPLDSIIFAEALGVFSAIVWAVESGEHRRILVYSDNSAVVYAFDSGRVSDELFDLVRVSYELLNRHGCDLRVRHIPGVHNFYADLLSRKDPPTFPFSLNSYGSTVHSFDPPSSYYLLRPLPQQIQPWLGRRLLR